MPPGPRWRRPAGAASWPCRSARSNSTGPTSRSTPTPGSPWPWRRGSGRAARGVAVAPAVAYGASGEHAGFPGTLLVGHEVLAELLVELVRSARRSFAGVVLVSAHGGNEEALAAGEPRCAADGDDVLVWRPSRPGGDAHAGRTETSLMLAIDPGAVRMRAGRSRVHRAPRRSCCPACAPKGCGRYRPTACWATPRVRAPRRAAALLDALVTDLVAAGGRRTGPSGESRSPSSPVPRGASAPPRVDALVAAGWQVVAVDRCADDPALDYRLAAKADLEAVAARHGAAVRPWWATSAAHRTCTPPWTRPCATSAASRPPSPWPASSAAARRCGRRADAQWDALFDVNVNGVRHLAAAAVPALLAGPRAAPGPGGGGGVGGGPAGAAPPERLQRVEARRHRPDALVGRRPGRHRHHRQRGVPRLDPGPMLDASAAVYGLASAEEFAAHQLVERLLEPEEPAALIAWLCGPDSGGSPGRRSPSTAA